MGNKKMMSQRSLTTERERERKRVGYAKCVEGRGHKKSVKRIGFLE